MTRLLPLLVSFLLSPGLAWGADRAPPFDSVDEVLAVFAAEPTVQQVQGWAAAHAAVEPGRVEGWMRASRTFALLPQVRVEYRVKSGWNQDYRYYPLDGVVTGPEDEIFDVLHNARRGHDAWVVLRGAWNLDELILSSERLRVIRESQEAVRLRDRVLTQVTQLYFERRRVQADLLLAPRGDLAGATREALRLQELTAAIDALTGGSYTEALERGPAPAPSR